MHARRLIDSLEHFAGVLPVVASGLTDEDARWRGPEDAWSILEVVTHMADEETADFRTRLEGALRDPDEAWPPIDPEGWAVERRYNEGVLAEVIDRFVRERATSVQWLRGLADPDWSRAKTHPRAGVLHAGDLLASWAAHDALHLRQIAKRRYQLIDRDAGDYSPAYAGTW